MMFANHPRWLLLTNNYPLIAKERIFIRVLPTTLLGVFIIPDAPKVQRGLLHRENAPNRTLSKTSIVRLKAQYEKARYLVIPSRS